jgi:hypothetical protein
MKQYIKPTMDIVIFDSGENIMQVSAANVNSQNVVNETSVNQLGK